MKAIKFIPVFSLFLLMGGSVASASPVSGQGAYKPVVAVRYLVNIHFSNDVSLCNLYLVEIVDENGRLITAPQAFRQGISAYYFSERGPVSGTRTAKLVLNSEVSSLICPVELHTSPFSITGEFLVGHTYEFNLYPSTHAVPPVPVPGGGVSAVGER